MKLIDGFFDEVVGRRCIAGCRCIVASSPHIHSHSSVACTVHRTNCSVTTVWARHLPSEVGLLSKSPFVLSFSRLQRRRHAIHLISWGRRERTDVNCSVHGYWIIQRRLSSQPRLVRPRQACIGVRKYSTRRTHGSVLDLTSDAGELALVRATLRRPG